MFLAPSSPYSSTSRSLFLLPSISFTILFLSSPSSSTPATAPLNFSRQNYCRGVVNWPRRRRRRRKWRRRWTHRVNHCSGHQNHFLEASRRSRLQRRRGRRSGVDCRGSEPEGRRRRIWRRRRRQTSFYRRQKPAPAIWRWQDGRRREKTTPFSDFTESRYR